jgi:hypothetical protein
MFNKIIEVPMHSTINSGLYKLSIPYFVGQSVNLGEEPNEKYNTYLVKQFPVEAYIRLDEDLENGLFARFVIYENEKDLVGYRYADLATVLRRSYFTTMFLPDNPETIKWIEYRSAEKNPQHEEEILEIELEWNKESASYNFVGHKKIDSIFG